MVATKVVRDTAGYDPGVTAAAQEDETYRNLMKSTNGLSAKSYVYEKLIISSVSNRCKRNFFQNFQNLLL